MFGKFAISVALLAVLLSLAVSQPQHPKCDTVGSVCFNTSSFTLVCEQNSFQNQQILTCTKCQNNGRSLFPKPPPNGFPPRGPPPGGNNGFPPNFNGNFPPGPPNFNGTFPPGPPNFNGTFPPGPPGGNGNNFNPCA